ncbi:MAG: glycosyltransferase family 87 protein [Acidimicrobiia bacterium]
MGEPASLTGRQRWRRTVYPLAAISVLFLLVVVVALTTEPGESRIGGDFPAFFAAGQVAGEGAWEDLYDPAVQQAAQEGLVDDEGGFLYFAYPPFVAAGYGALADLGYSAAFLIQTAVMAAALFAAVWWMGPAVPAVTAAPLAAFALAIFLYPMLTAVIGGQNTALTLALLVAAAYAESKDKEVLAGVAVGLLFYKPQFAVPLLLLLLVARRWKGAGAALVTGAGLWAMGAVLMGAGWVTTWWEEATAFASINADVNGHLFISLPGALQHVAGDAGAIVGWVLAATVAATVAVVWWRLGHAEPWVRYGLAAAGVILVLPQALFYEAGLLVLPLALLWTWEHESRRWVALLWASSWLQLFGGAVQFSPLLITVLVTFGWFAATQRTYLIKGTS